MSKKKEEIQKFMDREFPNSGVVVEKLGNKGAVLRKKVNAKDHRPGQTISGPTMMAVADAALYIAIFGELETYEAVTSQFSINFLSRPDGQKDLVCVCELIKMGKSLIVGNVAIYSEGVAAMVAHASGTYSIPKKSQKRP